MEDAGPIDSLHLVRLIAQLAEDVRLGGIGEVTDSLSGILDSASPWTFHVRNSGHSPDHLRADKVLEGLTELRVMAESIFQGIGHGRTIGDIPASLWLKVEGSNVKVEGSHDRLLGVVRVRS